MVHVEYHWCGYPSLQCCYEDLGPFLLLVFASFCFLIFIAVPRVARDLFGTLRYCPACRSDATGSRGSSLLEVHRS
jgi:hypothetical protein